MVSNALCLHVPYRPWLCPFGQIWSTLDSHTHISQCASRQVYGKSRSVAMWMKRHPKSNLFLRSNTIVNNYLQSSTPNIHKVHKLLKFNPYHKNCVVYKLKFLECFWETIFVMIIWEYVTFMYKTLKITLIHLSIEWLNERGLKFYFN